MPERVNQSKYRIGLFLKHYRRFHKYTGISLVLLLLVIAISGIILGWKKDAGELIMPSTKTGSTQSLDNWIPMDSLEVVASNHLNNYLKGRNEELSVELDRIDVRPSKGIAKFRFEPGYWEVQLDGATAEVLSTGKRYSDLFEKIHDGSWIEDNLGIPAFKLLFTTLSGLGLLFLSASGFWLWYGPIRQRKRLKRRAS